MVEDSTGPVGQQLSASRLVSIERASCNRNKHTLYILLAQISGKGIHILYLFNG